MTSRPGDGNVTVVFTPSGVHADVAPGTSLLDAARAVKVDLDYCSFFPLLFHSWHHKFCI